MTVWWMAMVRILCVADVIVHYVCEGCEYEAALTVMATTIVLRWQQRVLGHRLRHGTGQAMKYISVGNTSTL